MNTTEIGLAVLEGVGLAASPCILPILPLILASSAAGGLWRPVQIVLGFVFSFSIFSLVSRQIVLWTGVGQDTVQQVAFGFLLVFGLVMVIPALEEKFAALTGGLADKATALSSGAASESRFGGVLVGALIGLVWTPCAGPILAVALLQVIQSDTTATAALTILAFGLGAGLPMLAVGYAGQYGLGYVRGFSKYASVAFRRVMGVIILVFAGLGLAGFNVGAWLATNYSGTKAEQTVFANGLDHGLDAPYAAPEFSGVTQWLNSDPLTMASLRGKVVLVDFWTYSCINCIRTLPHIKAWYEQYKDKGFVVVGVHAPEFAFEGEVDNVKKAIEKFGITYPVAMDNGFKTWNAFENQYWPAHYLIDKDGRVVYTHFGEGEYARTEHNIRFLLGVTDGAVASTNAEVTAEGQTPETYLGTARAKREEQGVLLYELPKDGWMLTGQWQRTPQYIESTKGQDTLGLHYKARKVFLVMSSADGTAKTVTIRNGKDERTITVKNSELYELVTLDKAGEGIVEIIAGAPGVRMYAFTFES